MPLIDEQVRAAFPGFTDTEIEQFYAVAKRAAASSVYVCNTDLQLAIIARELGWEALKEYMYKATGDETISAGDIFSIATACHLLRTSDNATMNAAVYGAAAEATNKKTQAARTKSLKELTSGLKNYTVIEV